MELDQQSTHKQVGAKVEQLGPGSESDSNAFGEFALKSTVAGLGMLAQARMEVGRVDDPAEVEADAMALDFLRWQQSAGQQSAPAHEQISSGQTSRSSSNGTMETGGFAVGDSIESDISRETGRGSGLDGSTRGQFEGFFGVDLGGVRLHADSKAAELSRSLGAEAFTVGNDVFFGEGRFTPGSSSGLGLLAHELTHVVQQGGSSMRRVDPNAVAVSRSPLAGTQMIRRVDYNDSSNLEGSAMAEKASGGASAAAGMKDWEDVNDSFVKSEKNPDGVESAEGLALVSSTLNTISSITSLWDVFNEPSTTQDKGWAIFGALKSAADLSKSACEAAKAASTLGGGVLAVIPGLGLAISVMSFADTLINTFRPLWTASGSTKNVLENLQKQDVNTMTTEQKNAHAISVAAVETMLSTERRQIAFAVVDMVGDLTMIVGQIATLAAGPFGTAVTLLGVAVNLGGQAVKKATEWTISHIAAKKKEKSKGAETDVATAQANLDAAAPGADKTSAEKILEEKKKAFEKAKLELVKSDANTALKEVLNMAFAPVRAKTGPIDPTILTMLTSHGISQQFIASTSAALTSDPNAKIDYNAAVEEVAAIVAVGEPMTMGARIASWGTALKGSFGKVSAWFGRLFNTEASKMKATDVHADGVKEEIAPLMSIVNKYVEKKAKQGKGGVKADVLTDYLQKPYKSVLARILAAKPDAPAVLGIMKDVLTESLKDALSGAKLGESLINTATINVVVTQTSISVKYDPFPLTAVAAAPVTPAQSTAPKKPLPATPTAQSKPPSRPLPATPTQKPAAPAPAKHATVAPALGPRTQGITQPKKP
ncbi:MAG: DUF4157 domain-containing protein [Actinomycetes bacterium]